LNKEKMMKIIASFFVIILLIGVPALSAEKISLAVMDLDASGIPASEGEKITTLIRNELSNSRGLIVLDRKPAGRGSACADILCATQAGKELGADKVLVGSLFRMGEQLTITCRIIDVATGTVDFAENERALSQSDEFYMAQRFSDKVAGKITGERLYKEEDRHGDSIPARRFRGSGCSYRPAKDPFGWIALGSGIACAWGFAIAHESYMWRTRYGITRLFNDMYVWMVLPFYPVSPDFITYMAIKDYEERKNRRHRAERLRERNYYISAGVGGFAMVMLTTFIGRNIYHAAADARNAKSGDVSLIMPASYDAMPGPGAQEQLNVGLGLSMAF